MLMEIRNDIFCIWKDWKDIYKLLKVKKSRSFSKCICYPKIQIIMDCHVSMTNSHLDNEDWG